VRGEGGKEGERDCRGERRERERERERERIIWSVVTEHWFILLQLLCPYISRKRPMPS
jgi:hypothetical protein